MGDGGGRCECLPCPFPFLRLQQSLPSRRCALCLPYKGLSAGKPLPVLPCVAWPHCINAGGLGGLSFLLQPPGIHLHITVMVLSTHAGAEALLHGLRTDIYFCCCLWPHAVPSRVTAVRSRRREHLFGMGWRGVDVSGSPPIPLE